MAPAAVQRKLSAQSLSLVAKRLTLFFLQFQQSSHYLSHWSQSCRHHWANPNGQGNGMWNQLAQARGQVVPEVGAPLRTHGPKEATVKILLL